MRFALSISLAIVMAAALAACGTTKSDTSGEGQAAEEAIARSSGPEGRPTISEFCGEERTTVALVDGFGGNAWRKTLRAEFEEEGSKCDNIDETLYFDANGDPQKYISGVEGLVAKGADVIITFDDFGSATLGALRKATQAGVEVVPYDADPGGSVSTDYRDFISVDYRALTKEWVEWMDKALNGKGKLLFVGGPAGNPQDTKWLDAIKESIAEHPGLELAQDTFLATEFTPESVQQAVSGAISKYGGIDGYFSSYGAAMSGAIRAYENANEQVPAIATVASSNELGCLWQASSPHFELLSLDETSQLARIALRKGVAAAAEIEDSEPSGYQVQPFMDSGGGKEPPCNKELPPDADLSSSLAPEELAALFR